jgi:hypothetical protein
MIHLKSDAIQAVDYEPDSRRLHIWFTSGDQRYTYYRVPESLFERLIRAASPGIFFNEHIRGNYSL